MNVTQLRERVRHADEMMERGRSELVTAIREAHSAGMSQRQIASTVGRSQPEISRLLRFHGSGPNGLALRKARAETLTILRSAGLVNPRVFGSTARGEDVDGSDIDLLVSAPRSLGMLAQSKVEHELETLIGAPVEIVLDDAIRTDLEAEILKEAVPL